MTIYNMTKLAYQEGQDAFESDRLREENPYERTGFEQDWLDGYEDAMLGYNFYDGEKVNDQ